MIYKNLLLALTIAPSLIHAGEDDYLNEISQVNYQEGQEPHIFPAIDVAASGTDLTSRAIMGRAEFRLTAMRITDGEDKGIKHDVDKTSVASFDTNATLKAIGPAADPHNTPEQDIHRTQVGQGYDLEINASGLIPPGEGVSAAEASVYMEHEVYPFSDGQTELVNGVIPISVEQTDYEHTGSETLNKTVSYSVYRHVTDLTKLRGMETHTAFIKPDDTVNLKTQLNDTSIQVWPIGNGWFSFPEADTHRSLPIFTVTVEDLYPGTEVFFEITGGGMSSPVRVPIMTNGNETPFSNQFEQSERVHDAIKEAGTGLYNINLLKQSYFDTVTLMDLDLDYAPSISVRASVTSH